MPIGKKNPSLKKLFLQISVTTNRGFIFPLYLKSGQKYNYLKVNTEQKKNKLEIKQIFKKNYTKEHSSSTSCLSIKVISHYKY